MAVFSGLSEAVSAAALPFLKAEDQLPLILFVTLFPSTLLLLFFLTLWISPQRLYGPSDFRSDEGYLAAQRVVKTSEVYVPGGVPAQKLRDFWKPGGIVNQANASKLRDWLAANNMDTNSIATFLAWEEYEEDRKRAVADFSL
jgi:hypothetical protein